METRNILDLNGNVIGTVSYPEGTAESVWAAALSAYAVPPEPSPETRARCAILCAMEFGMGLIADFGARNVVAGLNEAEVAGIAAKLSSVQALLMSGSLKTAKLAIAAVTPDAYITQAVKDEFTDRINLYLGIG